LHHSSIGKNAANWNACGRATLAAMKMGSLLVTAAEMGWRFFEKNGNRLRNSGARTIRLWM